jgi:hypothetical protein
MLCFIGAPTARVTSLMSWPSGTEWRFLLIPRARFIFWQVEGAAIQWDVCYAVDILTKRLSRGLIDTHKSSDKLAFDTASRTSPSFEMSEAGPSSGVKVEDEAEAVADEFMDLDTPAEGAEDAAAGPY